MKERSAVTRSGHVTGAAARRNAASTVRALQPPAYGIDFIDRRAAPAPNRTGLPDGLKAGIEALSGMDLSAVRVHARSPEPARFNALAFAQGSDIHVAPGQDRHLAHEAWHVVQQAQGRVRPTRQMKKGVGINDDAALEREADAMGARALQLGQAPAVAWGQAAVPPQGLAAAPGGSAGTLQCQGATPCLQLKASAKAAAPVGKLHLFVDIEAASMGIKELKEGAVGHTWISLEYDDPALVPPTVHPDHKALLETGGKYSDPMGFWPDIQNNVFYSSNPLDSYVDGWMRHPDRAHEGAEKGQQTWTVTQPEVDAVIDYAESKRGAKYSVFFYNCTTFGVEAVKAAGKSAPSAGHLGVMYPNALYSSILARRKKGVGTTMTKAFDGTGEQSASGPDTKKG